MKKYIITLITLMLTLAVFGQAWKESKADTYAAEAQKQFQLNEAQTAQIKELWLARTDAFSEVGRKVKAGELSEAEKGDANLKVAKTYNTKMADILGISMSEFRQFNAAAMKVVRSS